MVLVKQRAIIARMVFAISRAILENEMNQAALLKANAVLEHTHLHKLFTLSYNLEKHLLLTKKNPTEVVFDAFDSDNEYAIANSALKNYYEFMQVNYGMHEDTEFASTLRGASNLLYMLEHEPRVLNTLNMATLVRDCIAEAIERDEIA